MGQEWSQWIGFSKFGIGSAPKTIGVYCLADGAEVIYVGKAEGEDGIYGRLQGHLSGSEGDCMRSARQYSYQECTDPTQVEFMTIESHVERHGKKPKCNDVTPEQ